MDLQQAKKDSRNLDPVFIIGKNGLTFGIIEQIIRILKKKKLIKVKMLRAYIDANENKTKKELGQEIADKTNSLFVESALSTRVFTSGSH